jgi:nicotinamide mononucleotide adenylyltransferase
MINPILIGRRIAEAIINQPGPCFYPGKFKPPHKGHYQAATELASRDYIQMVYIIISRKTIDGITPEDSLMIWNMYLQAEPNPKISVKISTDESPIVSIIHYLKANTTVDPVYIAVGDDEVDDIQYGKALQEDFGDRVKVIPVHEKAGIISAPHVRNILANGDFESFKEAVPEAAYNKGAAPKIFKMLATKVKGNGPKQA